MSKWEISVSEDKWVITWEKKEVSGWVERYKAEGYDTDEIEVKRLDENTTLTEFVDNTQLG